MLICGIHRRENFTGSNSKKKLRRINRSTLRDATKHIIFFPLFHNKVAVISLVLVTEMHREQVKDVLLLAPECRHNLTAAAFTDAKF